MVCRFSPDYVFGWPKVKGKYRSLKNVTKRGKPPANYLLRLSSFYFNQMLKGGLGNYVRFVMFSRVPRDGAISSFFFRKIQGAVCKIEQFIDIVAVSGKLRHSERDGQNSIRLTDRFSIERFFINASAEFFRCGNGPLLIGFGKEDDEFLPPEPGDEVNAAGVLEKD